MEREDNSMKEMKNLFHEMNQKLNNDMNETITKLNDLHKTQQQTAFGLAGLLLALGWVLMHVIHFRHGLVHFFIHFRHGLVHFFNIFLRNRRILLANGGLPAASEQTL